MTTSFRGRRLFVLVVAALATVAAAPTPTPTPEPRLTGGFGKTPAPGAASRKPGQKTKVRITNESLITEPDKGKLTTSDVRPAPTVSPKETPRPGGAATTPESAAEAPTAGEGEPYWRGEARRLRDRVAELKDAIARLEPETRKLESDFYSWDDGAYRDRVIKPAWDKAREQLATARRELPIAEKELADLPDRARKAGALPGWLRE
ncbi:MAG TPA: hypothetical protein VGB47_14110 [Thermoanaerobaculia bacterium]|jgi:hypothetical protein